MFGFKLIVSCSLLYLIPVFLVYAALLFAMRRESPIRLLISMLSPIAVYFATELAGVGSGGSLANAIIEPAMLGIIVVIVAIPSGLLARSRAITAVSACKFIFFCGSIFAICVSVLMPTLSE